MSNEFEKQGAKNGRPKKSAPPRIAYEELDRILVFGEVVPTDDGEKNTVVYPTYRQLAKRYNVAHSIIAGYAKRHNCIRRRKVAQGRIEAKADQKLVELRANAIAVSRDDAIRMIDAYLAGFEKALAQDRVRFDNPSDFNTMLRLKEFILGGADSRQEIHASLSLEDIQTRHKKMLNANLESTDTEKGLDGATPKSLPAKREANVIDIQEDSQDIHLDSETERATSKHVGPCSAPLESAQHEPQTTTTAPHNGAVALTGPNNEEGEED